MTDESDESPGEDPPADTGPPKPTGPVPPPPETLPTTNWLLADTNRGATVTMDGDGVVDNAVDVGVMSRILVSFERLVRILRAHRSGLEVKRRGRIVEVQGAPRLVAVPAGGGSYVVPLRLALPTTKMMAKDHDELEDAARLLALDGDDLFEKLYELPERVGDELAALLTAVADGHVDLAVDVYKNGQTTAEASISSTDARSSSAALEELQWSEKGEDLIHGVLFRIDTKRMKIALDVVVEDEDAEPQVIEATFPLTLLEDLRDALRRPVEIEVIVLEERRRYERSARARAVTVTSVRSLETKSS